MFHSPHALTILFGTQTGYASALAEWAALQAQALALQVRLADMAAYNTGRLGGERDVLIITSTHGEGEPPDTASDFFEFLDEASLPLHELRYAVLAVGDSGYDQFCEAGKRIDRRLEELGAARLLPRRDGDVGEKEADRQWLADAIARFAAATLGVGMPY